MISIGPIFDTSTKRCIGTLSGGAAACGNDDPDWYGRTTKQWTGGGTDDMPLDELGELLFTQKACNGCHSTDGSPGVGPTLAGLFGTTRALADGTTVTADENYLRESILVPAAKIAEGFQPIMPPIPMTDREVDGLIEFVKGL